MFKKIIKKAQYIERIFFEPILFAFTIFVMFGHIQQTINNADYATFSAWFVALKGDIGTHRLLYSIFFIMFSWWIWFRMRQDKSKQNPKIDQENG